MTPTQIIAFVAQILLTCSLSLLTYASMENGRYQYNTLTIPLFAELLKLFISTIFVLQEHKVNSGTIKLDTKPRILLEAALPALIYFISNNLNFAIIKELGPINFQLLSNLKILTTAVLFRVIMQVHLSRLQWRMLFILTIGCIVSQLTSSNDSDAVQLTGSTLGYTLKLCNLCLTALAAVLCEKFFKGNANPFHFQNVLLYGWGTLFTILSILIDGKFIVGGFSLLLSGHTFRSSCLILNYALAGIAASGVMKYLDTMAKTFAAMIANFVVAGIAVMYFGEHLRLGLVMGGVVAVIAVDVYYHGLLYVDEKISKTQDPIHDE